MCTSINLGKCKVEVSYEMTPGVYSYPMVLQLTLAQPHLLCQKIPCLFSGSCESQSSIFQPTRFPLLLGGHRYHGMRSLLCCLNPFCTVKSIYICKQGYSGDNQSVGLSVPVVCRYSTSSQRVEHFTKCILHANQHYTIAPAINCWALWEKHNGTS